MMTQHKIAQRLLLLFCFTITTTVLVPVNGSNFMQEEKETLFGSLKKFYHSLSTTKKVKNKGNEEEKETLPVNFKKLYRVLTATKKEVAHLKDQSLVFFVGDTGAGKTTTILYLLGKKLGLKNEADNPIPIDREIDLSDETDEFFGKIGHEDSSQTGFPMSYEGVNQDLAYVDFPGFFDTNGVEKDFCTAVTMRGLAETNKVNAVVFVVPWDDVRGARAKGIKTIIDTFYNTFPNFEKDKEQIMPSVFLAFTKTAATTEKIVKRFEKLKKNAKQEIKQLSTEDDKQQKTQLQRELAVYEYITQHKFKEHFLFPDPLGKDSEEVRKAILEKIKNAPVIDSGQFNLALNEYNKTRLKVALEKETKEFHAAIRLYETSVETDAELAKDLEHQNNILRDKQALLKQLGDKAVKDKEATEKSLANAQREVESINNRINEKQRKIAEKEKKIENLKQKIDEHNTDYPAHYTTLVTRYLESGWFWWDYQWLTYQGIPFVTKKIATDYRVSYGVAYASPEQGECQVKFWGTGQGRLEIHVKKSFKHEEDIVIWRKGIRAYNNSIIACNNAIFSLKKELQDKEAEAEAIKGKKSKYARKVALQKSAQAQQEKLVETIAELKKERRKNLKEKATQKKAVESKMPVMGVIVILKKYIDFYGKQYIDEGIATYYTLQEEVTD